VVTESKNTEDTIKIYNTSDALQWGVKPKDGDKVEYPKPEFEIKAPRDHVINSVKWGALDKILYYATDKGRLIKYNLEEKKAELIKDVHSSEIFSVEITKDFTMLFTCSRDGFCKLLHPDTFDEIRKFNHEFPVRNVAVSPLYLAEEN
jgi:WD40 repeat protein